jgi:hypothetical protein
MRIGRQAPLRLIERAFTTTYSTPRLILGFAAAVALGMLVACAPVEIGDPPGLMVQTVYVPVDPLARDPSQPVVIKNGKGEVLAQGVPDRQGNLTANPPTGNFDGTFVIESKRNDGSTDVQRVTYPAGQPVKLRRDEATGRYVAEVPPKRYAHPQITGEVGVMNLDRPNANLFRREDGGVVKGSAIQQDNKDDGTFGRVGVEFPLDLGGFTSKSTRAWLGLQAGYAESTASAGIGDIQANGDLFGIFTPGNGFVTGQDLRETAYTSEYSEVHGGMYLRKNYKVHGDFFIDSKAGVSYGRQSIEERLSTRTAISNTVFGHNQDTSSHYFGLPLSTSLWTNPLSGTPDLWFTAGGAIEPRYYRGETDWRVTATGFADRTQTLKDNGWTLGGGIHAGAYFGDPLNLGTSGFPVTAGFKVGVRWDAYPQVEYKNLNQGDGGATLEHSTGQSVFGAFELKFRF